VGDTPSNTLASHLDAIELRLKKTGVAATIEIVAYPDGHGAVAGHPVNGRDELLRSVGYLWDRALAEADKHAARRAT
jgi:hypothetical protein